MDLAEESYKACYYVVQHAEGEDQAKYAGFVEWLHQLGKIENLELMWFRDRLNVRFNRAQVYGLQAVRSETGSIMRYPVAAGYEERFEELGLKFNPETFNAPDMYEPIILEPDEFVIYGHVLDSKKSKRLGYANAFMEFDNGAYTITNDKGFYAVKVNKNNLPKSVTMYHIEGNIVLDLDIEENTDFLDFSYYLNDAKNLIFPE